MTTSGKNTKKYLNLNPSFSLEPLPPGWRIFFPFHSRCTTPTGASFPVIFQSVPPFSSPWPANNTKPHSFFQQRLPLHFPSHKPLLPFPQVFPSVSSSLSASPAFPQAFFLPLDSQSTSNISPSLCNKPQQPATTPLPWPKEHQMIAADPPLASTIRSKAPSSPQTGPSFSSNRSSLSLCFPHFNRSSSPSVSSTATERQQPATSSSPSTSVADRSAAPPLYRSSNRDIAA